MPRPSATTTVPRFMRRTPSGRRRVCATRRRSACSSKRAWATSVSLPNGARSSTSTASGRPALGREAAHSVRRVLHAGDATGREIGRMLWQRVCSLLDGDDHQSRAGHRDGRRGRRRARRPLLRSGRAADRGARRTRPCWRRGEPGRSSGRTRTRRWRRAMAWRWRTTPAPGWRTSSSCSFIPTALKRPDAPRFLISEALRGEGARLVNAQGDAFMARYHDSGDLAPRDVVARSIVREVERVGGDVFLTLRHLDAEYVHRRFPTIAEMVRRVGLDLARDPIPVGPAAHYIMGGIDTDEWARTSVAGLFAAGEVACTGVHGANRLASNSLLEGLVFGARAAIAMQQPPAAAPLKADRLEAAALEIPQADRTIGASSLDTAAVRDLMWRSRRSVPNPERAAGCRRAPRPRLCDRARPRTRQIDRRRRVASLESGHRGEADRTRGTQTRGEPRRPFPRRFSGARRSPLARARRRSSRRRIGFPCGLSAWRLALQTRAFPRA